MPANSKELDAALAYPNVRGSTRKQYLTVTKALAKTLGGAPAQKSLLALITSLAAKTKESMNVECIQLEVLASALRLASTAHDGALIALIEKYADVQGSLSLAFETEDLGLTPPAEFAALFSNPKVKAFHALYTAATVQFQNDPDAARKQWRKILASGKRSDLVRIVLGQLETHEADLTAWSADVEKLGESFAHQKRPFAAAIAKRGAAPVAKVTSVGTEGGPPLFVAATHLKAWRGVGDDYDRACDASGGSLIPIGDSFGIVLHAQSADVVLEPKGLLLRSEGKLDAAKKWKKVGRVTVGKGGAWVLDSAEPGKSSGSNRVKVALPAGDYDVLNHSTNDVLAVRLVKR